MPALVVDLFSGLGGWSEGFLSEGWRVVGFDIERHRYPVPELEEEDGGRKGRKPVEKRGWTQGCAVSLGMEGATKRPRTRMLAYPGQLVLQDVLTLHGSQFRHASCIVASPPCQEFSYMAMPWKRAKQIARALRGQDVFPEGYTGSRTTQQLTALFDACFRIQREACEAAGRYIPLVVENVKGAEPWVGPAKAHYGSYYLWGDVASVGGRIVRADVMPRFGVEAVAARRARKTEGHVNKRDGFAFTKHLTAQFESDAQKRQGRNFHGPERGESSPSFNGADHETRNVQGTKQHGSGPVWFDQGIASHGSHSDSRKAASAMIAKIPAPLARHIARVFRPEPLEATA